MAALSQSAPGSRRDGGNHLGVGRFALRRSVLMIVGVRAAMAALLLLAPFAAARAGNDTATSGLPVPRFVSVKADRVNVRGGPDKDHDVSWVYTRVGWPVEIIAEFENWRRIRDSDGAEGWVYHSMLSGKRTAAVQLKAKADLAPLYAKPDAQSGRQHDCSPACSARSSTAPGLGAASSATASTAGSSRTSSGASIPTRRWSSPDFLNDRRAFYVMAGLVPAIHVFVCIRNLESGGPAQGAGVTS